MPTLVALIVTYNRLEQLKVGMERLLREECSRIVVVDNCSTDGTRDWLESFADRESRLDVVLAERNLGGAGGFELGFRHVFHCWDPDWIVCFDDDAYPESGAFRAFLESDLSGVDAAAAAVYYKDGRICDMNCPSRNPFWRPSVFLRTVVGGGREAFHLESADYEASWPVKVDAASFVGLFVSRLTVQRVGYPEGRLFIYGDDVLYTLSISRTGGNVYFLPWVRFVHDCSTFAARQDIYDPLWKAFYTYRNGVRVYRTASGVLFWLFFPFKVVRWALKARCYDSPGTYLKVMACALYDALRGNYSRPHQEILQLCENKDKARRQ